MRLPQTLLVSGLLIGTASADDALGTFTVKGRTARLLEAYVSMDTDPEDPGRKYLVALLSDVPVAPADRRGDRLLALAREKRVRALKVRWGYGLDDIACVPYHADIAESGKTHRGYMILDLGALDEKKVRAHVRSKMLGQDWHFDARVEGNLRPGGVVELEPPADEAAAVTGDAEQDPVRDRKRALGRMGYEATPEGFDQAVRDGNAEAVRLFLEVGMDPNTRDSRGDHVMLTAALFCAYGPADARGDAGTGPAPRRLRRQRGEGPERDDADLGGRALPAPGGVGDDRGRRGGEQPGARRRHSAHDHEVPPGRRWAGDRRDAAQGGGERIGLSAVGEPTC